MDIIKIIGVGIVALIIIVILKQYKPEFAMYASIIAGAIIIFFSLDKISAIINLLTSLSKKTGLLNSCVIPTVFLVSRFPVR